MDKLGGQRLTPFFEMFMERFLDRNIHMVRNWGSVQMNWETDRGEESCERCANNERICKGNVIFSLHNVDMGGETIPELTTRISTCDRYFDHRTTLSVLLLTENHFPGGMSAI